ncbi:signal peptidase I [Bacillus tianshenii]|nr:signal peptidase I [Bacillus tianshenii]
MKKEQLLKETWDWGKTFLIVFGIALFVKIFLFAPYLVEGSSMEGTLKNHDRVLVNSAVYLFDEPKRGDVVILRATEDENYVKRVIAIAGDKVEVRDDTLYINDQPVKEDYLEEKKKQAKQQGLNLTNDIPPQVIPKGHVFVLGDNRPNSLDSEELGSFEVQKVIGKAEFVFYPFDTFRFIQ